MAMVVAVPNRAGIGRSVRQPRKAHRAVYPYLRHVASKETNPWQQRGVARDGEHCVQGNFPPKVNIRLTCTNMWAFTVARRCLYPV